MTSFIKVPFASSGDKVAVPDTDAGGGVNMTQGYGQAYSLDPATDPSAKRIERDKMNWLFNRITQAINEIQSGGVAPFITSADNGGSAFSYGKGALVSLGGVVYQSLVANNTATPPGANWAALPEKIQPLDATLTALAGLVGAANKLPYFNGADTAALTDLTSVGRDIIGKADVAAVLTYLGLSEVVLGDDCSFTGFAYGDETKPYLKRRSDDLIVLLQPFDETLSALAGLANGANKLPYFTDTDKMAVADLSVFMRGILGKTSAATARQYLELAEASTREVGTGANQIPDMSSFSASLAVQGHAKEPSGLIRQWLGGNTSGIPAGGSVVITFPFPFPNELLAVVPYSGSQQAGFEAVVGIQWVNRSQIVLYNSSMTKPVTDYGYIAYGK